MPVTLNTTEAPGYHIKCEVVDWKSSFDCEYEANTVM